jgi:hypothetical protein
MTEWYFPSNDHGENKGINDSGVATFRGTPLKSLAREICQNSLDAQEENNIPVKIDFCAFDIPSTSLPGADYLKDTFERCVKYWSGQVAKTTKETFSNAIDKITAQTIHMMRISDFNTKGLCGSQKTKDINTDWMRLTKSSGSSDKKGPAGGSYGIGKFAPFACSDLLTVFYNTYDIEDNCAYQGVSRLVTFEREDKETTQGIGYYGNEKNTPVFEQINLDPNFKRNVGEYGTDIYIAGYKYNSKNWEDEIVISVLDGFLGAIWNNKLVVKVGEIVINKENLSNIMEMYHDDLEGKYVLEYYSVLTSAKTKWFTEENFMNLGKIKFGVLLAEQDEQFHRKAAMIRQTGMKIKDADRISTFIQFAAIMFIEGNKINEQLRTIENPEHTEWQPSRAQNPIVAGALVKSLQDFMKKKLEEIIDQENPDQMDATGVSEFLPDSADEDSNKQLDESITDKVFEIEKRIVTPKSIGGSPAKTESPSIDEGNMDIEPGEGEDDWYHDEDKRPTPTLPDPKPPTPVKPVPGDTKTTPKSIDVRPAKFIPICTDAKQGKYIILFTPSNSGTNGIINLYLSGETEIFKAPIKSATLLGGDKLECDNNSIKGLTFTADKPIKISIEIDFYDYCSMEVKASADKA